METTESKLLSDKILSYATIRLIFLSVYKSSIGNQSKDLGACLTRRHCSTGLTQVFQLPDPDDEPASLSDNYIILLLLLAFIHREKICKRYPI